MYIFFLNIDTANRNQGKCLIYKGKTQAKTTGMHCYGIITSDIVQPVLDPTHKIDHNNAEDKRAGIVERGTGVGDKQRLRGNVMMA